MLDENGHPRNACEGDQPHRTGLVLQWVYGDFESPAEKARDAAKRTLGTVDLYHASGAAFCLFILLLAQSKLQDTACS